MFMRLYDIVTKFLRKPKYHEVDAQINRFQINDLTQLQSEFKKIPVKPGQSVFFWNRKIDYIDHIAIVPAQETSQLNLLEAKLVHGAPPPLGDKNDLSGIRTSTAIEFMGNLNAYSRIIVGSPPDITDIQLQQAGELASEMSLSKKINNQLALYSFPFFRKLFYVKWFDFDTHLKFKVGLPKIMIRKTTGQLTDWVATYCGDLVGRIYQELGIPNLPQIKFLGRRFFRSSTFYEWMKSNNKLEAVVIWNDKLPEKY